MEAHRRRLRQAGLRPVQIWVPDVKARGFAARLKRQVAGLDAAHERDTLRFIEAAAAQTLDE
jgi:hypothetical protein